VVHTYIDRLIEEESLPQHFHDTVSKWYAPLAQSIATKKAGTKTPLVLGVQGTQGSGKSTLANFLKALLENEHALKTVSLSLDDFYLTRAERSALADNVHPLFIARGVPGTHDVNLAINTIRSLKSISKEQTVAIPRFNKAIDDRFGENNWGAVSDSIDVIIFEGWCVGCDAQETDALHKPVNAFEESEDPEAIWRTYANKALASTYQDLFSLINYLVVLNAPSFECVFDWRLLQEKKLRERWESSAENSENHILSEAEVIRFVSHYERLTRHCLRTLPNKADWLLPLNSNHEILNLIKKNHNEK